jgi:Flp pilus assembly protein TadB
MNIKQMAIVNVAKLVGFAVAVGVIVNLGIHYMGLATVGVILAVGVLAYMIKFMYDIELSKLESKNALTKLKELE